MMSSLSETIADAQTYAQAIRPKVGGFPYLAEVLRRAGVVRFQFTVAPMTGLFVTERGSVVQPGPAIVSGLTEVPGYSETKLVAAIRADQAGETTFPEFAQATWAAGVVWYEVDLVERTCTYFGAAGDRYVEAYPAVELPPRQS